MKISLMIADGDTTTLKALAQEVFEDEDSNVDEWFSFSEMSRQIELNRGACFRAVSETDELLGYIYGQQESPINGVEGIQKWVIVITAVSSDISGQGIGGMLLTELEKYAASQGAMKMFVYTNQGDARVINFYIKNGYSKAGTIKEYQYGHNNAADFLLKYL